MPCKGSIILVEDDPDLRDAFAECFGDLGCTVIAAEDGVHAQECLAAGGGGAWTRPCLILLDLQMPRLDGAGLAAFVRAHARYDAVRMISMSAGSERLRPPLVECHHTKPFAFPVLLPAIEAACQDPEWLHGAR